MWISKKEKWILISLSEGSCYIYLLPIKWKYNWATNTIGRICLQTNNKVAEAEYCQHPLKLEGVDTPSLQKCDDLEDQVDAWSTCLQAEQNWGQKARKLDINRDYHVQSDNQL